MLEIKDIYKTFNKGTINEKRALQGVSLTLNDGDFVTVIGGNGAGKSTMLNAVAGTYTVDAGSILIDGVDVTRLPEHKRAKFIGRVFQDPMMGTAPTMQIEENLALAARRGKRRGLGWGINAKERARYREELKKFDLGLEDRLTKTAAKVLELSDRIVEENGLTTMMVTHNMRDAIAHGNRLIMLYNGRIVVDIAGDAKKNITVPELLELFNKASGSDEADDKLLLS